MSATEGKQTEVKTVVRVGLGLLIIIPLVLIVFELRHPTRSAQTQAYFSVDDGASWYADDINNIPPYMHNGKEAVRAMIFNYAGGSKEFCGYLLRYTPDAVKAINAAAAAAATSTPPRSAALIATGEAFASKMQVKKPNSHDEWVPMQSQKGSAVTKIVTPDGSEFDSVLP